MIAYVSQLLTPSGRTFLSVRLIEVVNNQHSTVTLYRDKVACCLSSSSLPFITNVNLIVNAKALTVFSTYFKDVIQYSARCPLKTRYLNSCYTMECCHSFLNILHIGSTFFFF